MKKLLMLGAALLGLCTIGQTVRAGDDGPDYRYEQRPAPRYYEDCRPERRCYLPPPPPVFLPPLPRVLFYSRPHYRRHSYPYGYRYGCAPGVHIGIGF